MFRFLLWTTLGSLVFSCAVAVAQGSSGRRIQDPNYVVTRTVEETIVSTDLKSSQLVLKGWDGRNHAVTVNKDTKLASEAHKLDLRDLQPGQTIRLTYRVKDGTALEITLLAQHPRK